MNAEFYQGNRQRLYDSLPDHTLLLLFSGSSIRKTADENYPFYADRSFLYLTGIGQEHTVLMAEKDGEEVQETLYILPPDMLAERWTGKRFTPESSGTTASCGPHSITRFSTAASNMSAAR